MRRVSSAGLGVLFVVSSTLWGVVQETQAQQTQPQATEQTNPVLSQEPITEEQAEIYRAFLASYTNGRKSSTLNVANQTEALELSEDDPGQGCLKGLQFDNLEDARKTIHTLDSRVMLPGRTVLVDPDKQRETVRENDPQHAIDRRDKSIDKAVDIAFASGLFTFSEILYDKTHRYAVMRFSFFCGRLCGHGAGVLFHKAGGKWKLTNRECGSWIS